MSEESHFLSLSIAFASSFLLGNILISQETSLEEEIFELSEFRVEASSIDGYLSTNATSGTLLNSDLKNTPFAIDVVTPDFINDTGSTDIREVLAYDSGVMLDNTLARSDGNDFTTGVENDDRSINNADTDVVIRGFRAPTLKNGFFTLTRVDSINIGRVERASGPTSLLYGVGAISGITNVITKTPSDLNTNLTQLGFFAGNNDYKRFTLDQTNVLKKFENLKPMTRLNFAWQEEATLFPHEKEETFFIAPTLELSPTKSTRLVIEFEYALRNTDGIGTKDIEDNLYPRFTEENEAATLLRDKIFNTHYVNISGPDASSEENYFSPRFELTQKIGDSLTLLFAGNFTQLDVDTQSLIELRHIPTAFPDAFLASEASVQDYIDNSRLEYGWANTTESQLDKQIRLSALYQFEWLGEEQNFVFGRQERSLESDYPNQGGNFIGNGDIVERSLNDLPIQYQGEPTFSNRTRRLDNQWYQGHYLIFQGSFFDRRIRPVLGYRWDKTQTRARRFDRITPSDPWARDQAFLSDRGAIDGYDRPINQETPTLGLSVSLTDNLSVYGVYSEGIALSNTIQQDGNGLSFEPPLTRNKEIGIKYDFLDGKISGRITFYELDKRGGVRYSFYAPFPAEGNFDPSQPVVYELNDRQKTAFEAWSGINLEQDYNIFKTPSADGPTEKWAVPYDLLGQELSDFALHLWNEADNFDQWRSVYTNDGPYFSSGNNPSEDRGAYHNFNEQSQGMEIRINLRPVPEWQTLISYTYNEVIVTSGLSNLAGGEYDYYGIHPVFYYTGGPENFTDFRPESYAGNLGAGTINNDTPKHSLSVWSKYAFSDGFLKGLELALGYRFQGERLAQSPWFGGSSAIQDAVGSDGVRPPVPSFGLWDFVIKYKWEKDPYLITFGLNIRNAFDLRSVEAQSNSLVATLEDGSTVPLVTRYYLSEGRNIRLSIQIQF